ncbi:uncharacterized protein LOC124358010 isoform X6 [Homalodisca vitripennis]|uniref:uncharacterized protein LOC124358010 isoform X6 n=1 Tax=Homalodisca vitripennis TaxID=197043 RepID=UPI001EEA1FAD|nr:uncharacterized protein LOC124358010 isoform X6 [Homalodisca vitripennis]
MYELAFLLVVAVIPLTWAVTLVQEVSLGETAILKCPSNDDNHRFQFWQLQTENLVIGPTNHFNKDKYKYDVLTGKLHIRGVSSNEHGLYTCVCKHITDNSFFSETVELLVKRDWEDVYETDPFPWLQMKSLLMKLARLTELPGPTFDLSLVCTITISNRLMFSL